MTDELRRLEAIKVHKAIRKAVVDSTSSGLIPAEQVIEAQYFVREAALDYADHLLGCSTITETTHATPTGDDGLTPCCGRTPLELPRTDRLTLEEALVTCFTITDRQVEAADEWMRGFLWRHFGMGTTGRFGREMLEAARVVHREET